MPLSAIILHGCNKDQIAKGPQRVVMVESYQDQMKASVTQIKYSDNKVVEMNGDYYYTNGDLAYKTLTKAFYTDDSIRVTDYYDNYGSWVMESMDLFEMDGGKVVRRAQAIGGLTDFRRIYEYWYNGHGVEQILFYYYGEPETKTLFEYSGSNLVSKFIYSNDAGEWILTGQDTLYYHGDVLDSTICFLIDGTTKYYDRKLVYQFMDTLLLQEVEYRSYDSLNWSYYDQCDYQYDDLGNLITRSRTIGSTVYSDEYTYEPGEGNFWLLRSLP